MKKNKLYELITLILRCSLVFIFICFIANMAGSLVVFFKLGYLEVNLAEVIPASLKKGFVVGGALGLGLWIKSRLQERR